MLISVKLKDQGQVKMTALKMKLYSIFLMSPLHHVYFLEFTARFICASKIDLKCILFYFNQLGLYLNVFTYYTVFMKCEDAY